MLAPVASLQVTLVSSERVQQLKSGSTSADKMVDHRRAVQEGMTSVSGISSSNFYNYGTQSTQNSFQKAQQEFQQLGQDLQSGNLSAAQSDFTTLQNLQPKTNSTSPSQSDSPIAQAFNQLSQDLQSGNLSAAQQDFATIQQDFQNQSGPGQSQNAHGHHHHHEGNSSGEQSAVSQAFQQLGQALQSDNLTSAQQAYSTLQQDFSQTGQTSGQTTQSSAPSSSSSLSVTA